VEPFVKRSEPTPTAAGDPSSAQIAEVDALVIGGGPVGLFQVFELGLLGMTAHLVDALPHAGGQCIELYPDKPIYGIPAVVETTGRRLIETLLTQIKPFKPQFHLKQLVNTIARQEDGRFLVTTSQNNQQNSQFLAKTIFIAAGLGAFQPKKVALASLAPYVDTQLFYHMNPHANFKSDHVVVLGGEDSAIRTAISLVKSKNNFPKSVTLIHRRDVFTEAHAAENADVATLRQLVAAGKLKLRIGQLASIEEANQQLTHLNIVDVDGKSEQLPVDILMVYQGISPKLGPVSEWGLEIERHQIKVDPATCATSEPGIFAIGDVSTYPGKKKLIHCGFHECTMAAFAAAAIVFPGTPVPLQYTTTSTQLHQRLGVSHTSKL
jgi:thioredoxin reductase (NADPH)